MWKDEIDPKIYPQNIFLSPEVSYAICALENEGFEAFAVGGAVRDSLLGKNASDFDITTSAKPEQIKQTFSSFNVIETGIKHGTVTVIINGASIEITTYRVDGEYDDNRHPRNVIFASNLEDDLSRRDFTVNALAYNPRIGVVDMFDGLSDLKNKIIRTVGNGEKRFSEDALRILRCVRFSSVLGFDIEKNTETAVRKLVGLLENISAERLFSELKKLICGQNAGKIIEDFPEVITKVVPELSKSVGFEQKSKYHIYDVYTHTARAIGESNNNIFVRLALLYHDCGKPYVYTEEASGARHFKGHQEVSAKLAVEGLSRLKCDNKTIKRVSDLVLYHDYPLTSDEKSVRRLLTKLTYEDAKLIAKIRYADMKAHAEQYAFSRDYTEKVISVIDSFKKSGECVNLKTLAVTGDDLLNLGIPKGKKIGEILNILLENVLENNVPNEKRMLLKKAKEMIDIE